MNYKGLFKTLLIWAFVLLIAGYIIGNYTFERSIGYNIGYGIGYNFKYILIGAIILILGLIGLYLLPKKSRKRHQ